MLVLGIGASNLSFVLDAINIYCRHWYQDYSLNRIVAIFCSFLFFVSVILLVLYCICSEEGDFSIGRKNRIMIVEIFLLCYIMQLIGSYVEILRMVPWTCIGYLFFCAVQFTFLFDKSKQNVIQDIDDKEHGKKCDAYVQLLTKREQEIADCICEGKSNKEIAETLVISQNTARNHIYNIYKKLGVKNKVELLNKLHELN